MSVALKAAKRAATSAQLAVENTLKRDYPVGAPIRWASKRHGHRTMCEGAVVAHMSGEWIRVRDDRIKRKRAVHVSQILEALQKVAA